MLERLAHVEHQIEAARPTVIGIRHLVLELPRAIERHEQAQARLVDRRAQPPHGLQMPAIHRQQQVELLKITHLQLARAQPGQIVAAQPGRLLRARIGCLADVVTVRPGGIHLDPITQRSSRDQMTRHAFGGGRSADVAGAHEQDSRHLPSPLIIRHCRAGLRQTRADEA